MKQDLNPHDLRAAFRDEPDACHQALMTAVRSIREEEDKAMKHLNLRPLLIAAIIIVSMLTVAFAASEIFGLNEFFGQYGITPSTQLQNAMQPEQPAAFTVGPVTFTVQERVADPYYAYISTKVAMTDGSQALMCMYADDAVPPDQRTALNLHMIQHNEGDTPTFTRPLWTDAAQQTGLPLYSVRAILEIAEDINGGEGMEDVLYDSTGCCVYVNNHNLQNVAAGADLPATLFLRVSKIDPVTGEELEKWTTREPYTIPVSKLLAQGSYLAETPFVSGDMTLTNLQAELYATGLYVCRHYQLPEGTPFDYEHPVMTVLDTAPLLDGSGNPFEQGVSLSSSFDIDSWPDVTVKEMINVTELPPVIQVGGVTYTLQRK